MYTRRDFIATTLGVIGATAIRPQPAWAAPKSILILGGTGLVGPHQVRRALERGHQVTIFNRGRSAPGLFGKEVEQLVGDCASTLDALKGRKLNALGPQLGQPFVQLLEQLQRWRQRQGHSHLGRCRFPLPDRAQVPDVWAG
jgi:hypothetical protein